MSSVSDGRSREPEEPPIRFTDRRKVDRERRGGGREPRPARAPDAGRRRAARTRGRRARRGAGRRGPRYRWSRRRCSTSAPPTCSACRPSTPTTAGGPSATGCSRATLAVGRVLADLLPVIDDIDRARAHGDLDGRVQGGGRQARRASLAKLGLVAFGAVGRPVRPGDPRGRPCTTRAPRSRCRPARSIMRPGYRHDERLLRPAMVGVSDPAEPVGRRCATRLRRPSRPASDPASPGPSGPGAAPRIQKEVTQR